MRTRLILLLTLLLITVGKTSAQQSDSANPYLYWYSSALNAFVIERADGTESRLFGDGLMPQGTDITGGPGWSPSGEWFAWTAFEDRVYNYSKPIPFGLHVSGERRITQLDRFFGASLTWAPDEDLLFVAGETDDHNRQQIMAGQDTTTTLALIDAQTDSIVSEHIMEGDGEFYETLSSTQWTSDGDYLMAAVERSDATNADERTVVYLLGDDGTITEKSLTGSLVESLTPSGYAIYLLRDEQTLVMENVITGEKVEFTDDDIFSLERFDFLRDIRWNADYSYLVFATKDEAPRDFYLLDVENRTLEPAFSIPAMADRYATSPASDVWSPSGRYIVYTGLVDTAFIFDAQTGTSTELVEEVISATWTGGDHLLVAHSRDEDHNYSLQEFDVSTGEIIADFSHITDDYWGYWPTIGPNNDYAVYVGRGPVIYNMETQQAQAVRPHASKDPRAIDGGEIDWHPGGEWFITGEYSLVASGGTGPYMRGVVRASDGFRRDFSVCTPSQCARWLPSQVDVSELPPAWDESIFREPDFTLTGHQDFVLRLSWSPDGRYLASGEGVWAYDEVGWDYVWDMDAHEIITELESPEHPVLTWERGSTGEYVPHMESVEPESPSIYATSPDGELVVGNIWRNRLLSVMDAVTLEELYPLEDSWYDIDSLSFSPDGRLIAGGAYDLAIWDASNGDLLATLDVYANAVAFSPDGHWLAVGSGWNIQIWDVETLLGDFLVEQMD